MQSFPQPACREVSSVRVPDDQMWPDQKSRETEPFAYDPLPTSSAKYIRLVEVLPGKGDDRICCRLFAAECDGDHAYEAVSYVWGRQGGGDAEILVNDAPFRVTSNLFGALRTVRSSSTPKTLWADAICINQNDNRERSTQVQFMRHIYECAVRVLVWLGPEDADDETAVGLINFLSANRGTADVESCRELGFDKWDALFRFFELPYFCRTWIIQEIQANPDTLVMCGQATTTYSAIETSARVALQSSEDIRQRMITDRGISNATYIRTLMAPDATLLSRLSQTRGFFASDARDKVFAFLRPEDTMVPDYAMSECDVFRAAACQMLQEDSHETLSYVVHDNWFDYSCDEIPSWVPKFDMPFILPLCKVRGLHAGRSPHETAAKPYRVEEGELNISSILIDRIVMVYPVFKWEYFQLPQCNNSRHCSSQGIPTFMDWLWEHFGGVEVNTVGLDPMPATTGPQLLSRQSLAKREEGRHLRLSEFFRKAGQRGNVSHVPFYPTRREFAATITAGIERRGLGYNSIAEHEKAFLGFSKSLFSCAENFDSRLDRELRDIEIRRFKRTRTCAAIWWDNNDLIKEATKFVNDNGGAKASSPWGETDSTDSHDKRRVESRSERSFQTAVQTACNNRCLFLTETGRLGLGPSALEPGCGREKRVWDKHEGKDPGHIVSDLTDSPLEVRIFPGAATPFITQRRRSSLSHVLVGECYVYGMMNGEALESGKVLLEEISVR
ncbi:heterokaryon incompatibility protein-domain-containing protein [Echria macrotheca]|uniref:Heterokaryon incompatibility protein-domain-containing protein n=1 Tax=Echria macrotheca TaxID=438768 RepID=A0AAJ0F689_9PEZI|nr:heterokaryon incompatibility protein-domain-containing protein [Echria macrotheca]